MTSNNKHNEDKVMNGKRLQHKSSEARAQHASEKIVSQKTKSQPWTTKEDQSPS